MTEQLFKILENFDIFNIESYKLNLTIETITYSLFTILFTILGLIIIYIFYNQIIFLLEKIINFSRNTLITLAPLIFLFSWFLALIYVASFPNEKINNFSEIFNFVKIEFLKNAFITEGYIIPILVLFTIGTLIILYFINIFPKAFTLLISGFLILIFYPASFDDFNPAVNNYFLENIFEKIVNEPYLFALYLSIFIILLITIFKLYQIIFGSVIKNLLSGLSNVYDHVLHLSAIIIISSFLIGFLLTFSVSLISATEYNFIYVILVSFIFLWTWNFILLFVKTFSAIIFGQSNIRKDINFFEFFIGGLYKTINNFKGIIYISFIPTFLSIALLLISSVIYNFENMVNYNNSDSVSIIGIPFYMLRMIILILLRLLVWPVIYILKNIIQFNIELSIVSIGLYPYDSLETLWIKDHKEAWKTIKNSLFSFVIHLVPVFICSFFFFIFKTSLVLSKTLNLTWSNLFVTSFYISLPENLAKLCSLDGNTIVLFGICLFICYSLVSIAYTSLIFNDERNKIKSEISSSAKTSMVDGSDVLIRSQISK